MYLRQILTDLTSRQVLRVDNKFWNRFGRSTLYLGKSRETSPRQRLHIEKRERTFPRQPTSLQAGRAIRE